MKLAKRTGGSLKKSNIIFSHGDKYLLACKGDEVVLLDGHTLAFINSYGLKAQTSEKGQGKPLVSICLHPTINGAAYAADEDTIYLFEYESGRLIKPLPVSGRIDRLLSAFTPDVGCAFVVTAKVIKPASGKEKLIVQRTIWSLSEDKISKQFDIQYSHDISLSVDGEFLTWNEAKKIFTWKVAKDPSRSHLLVRDVDQEPLCLAVQPVSGKVFYSSFNGRIHGLTEDDKKKGNDSLHWHSHALNHLSANPDAASLLSGGEEGVLVVWNLLKSTKQYLPHLGAPIIKAASGSGNEYYAVMTAANTIYLVSPGGMQIIAKYSCLQGVTKEPVKDKKVGIIRNPVMSSRVTVNSFIGQLETINPLSNIEGSVNLDVCQQSYIGRGQDGKPMMFSDVFAAAYSVDGRWMATYERRDAEDRRLQMDSLKFWRQRDGTYHMYVAFDAPHSAPIKSISFSPASEDGVYTCATVGEDAKVSLWASSGRKVVGFSKKNEPVYQTVWNLERSISCKGLLANAACFSSDGSLLAIAFGTNVRLCDPASGKSYGALATFGSKHDIECIQFVGDYLVGADRDLLCVWHIPSMKTLWTLDIHSESIKASPITEEFAVLATLDDLRSFILTFSPTSPIPKTCSTHPAPLLDLDYLSLKSETALVALDQYRRVLVFSGDQSITEEPEATKKECGFAPEIAVLMANAVVPIQEILAPFKAAPSHMLVLPPCSTEKLLMSQIPGHELPSVADLFEHYIKYKLAKCK